MSHAVDIKGDVLLRPCMEHVDGPEVIAPLRSVLKEGSLPEVTADEGDSNNSSQERTGDGDAEMLPENNLEDFDKNLNVPMDSFSKMQTAMEDGSSTDQMLVFDHSPKGDVSLLEESPEITKTISDDQSLKEQRESPSIIISDTGISDVKESPAFDLDYLKVKLSANTEDPASYCVVLDANEKLVILLQHMESQLSTLWCVLVSPLLLSRQLDGKV